MPLDERIGEALRRCRHRVIEAALARDARRAPLLDDHVPQHAALHVPVGLQILEVAEIALEHADREEADDDRQQRPEAVPPVLTDVAPRDARDGTPRAREHGAGGRDARCGRHRTTLLMLKRLGACVSARGWANVIVVSVLAPVRSRMSIRLRDV